MKRTIIATGLMALVIGVYGCGQKGPLRPPGAAPSGAAQPSVAPSTPEPKRP